MRSFNAKIKNKAIKAIDTDSRFPSHAGALAGIPAVHACDRAGAAHPDHDHCLLRHLQEAPVLVQLQRLPQQVVIIWSFVSDNRQ